MPPLVEIELTDLPKPGWAITHPANPSPTSLQYYYHIMSEKNRKYIKLWMLIQKEFQPSVESIENWNRCFSRCEKKNVAFRNGSVFSSFNLQNYFFMPIPSALVQTNLCPKLFSFPKWKGIQTNSNKNLDYLVAVVLRRLLKSTCMGSEI